MDTLDYGPFDNAEDLILMTLVNLVKTDVPLTVYFKSLMDLNNKYLEISKNTLNQGTQARPFDIVNIVIHRLNALRIDDNKTFDIVIEDIERQMDELVQSHNCIEALKTTEAWLIHLLDVHLIFLNNPQIEGIKEMTNLINEIWLKVMSQNKEE